jgi:hypothetical protein
MYRATLELIKERKKHCQRLEPRLVNVQSLPQGEIQDCFHNSVRAQSIDFTGSGTKENLIRSGWIVHPYNSYSDTTEIIQHWWNYDPKLKIHFDTTPFNEGINPNKVEYVEDNEFCEVGTSILDQLECNVGHDLMYHGKSWIRLETQTDGSINQTPLENLSTRNLLIFKKHQAFRLIR